MGGVSLVLVLPVFLFPSVVAWGSVSRPRRSHTFGSRSPDEEATMTDTTRIQNKMDVICSCGTRIGKVDHLEGDMIKLAKNDPASGGKHHWVPLDWVEKVDQTVHLNKDCDAAVREWRTEPAGKM